ncbi:EAL domain-containing protein [Pararobbsia silviterrae]|uniref:EAL domain-containing protein n=2 Tax=Pararobbsia silviterrae TaxID=1792498 RepID=A0A494XYU8_9BURK|nr:EAL domain-containing protein [Pararobbsia silviterrae]
MLAEPDFAQAVGTPLSSSASAGQASLVYLGRQPILERSRALHGYELLFRADSRNEAHIRDHFEATAYVVARTFGEFGLREAIGPHTGYLNFSRDLLFSDVIHLIPPDRFVIEILEDTVFDAPLIARCAELRKAGFRLAMDDVATWSPELVEAVPHIDMLKVDFLQCNRDRLSKIAALAKRERKTLLAEKIETHADFELAKTHGFDLFQGYFFARPQVLRSRSTGPAQRCLLQLLIALSGEADVPALESALKQSPQLMVRILRFANSTASGVGRRIGSLREAILAVGTRKIARWVQLMIYADGTTLSPESDPLIQLVGARARLMELMIEHCAKSVRDEVSGDAAYMTGVLSLTPVILGIPTRTLSEELKLPAPIRDALIDRQGALGHILSIACAFERGEAEVIAAACEALGTLTPDHVAALGMRAAAWNDDI